MTEPRGTAPASAAGAEPTATEPTQAEIDEWAARERQRREAWLKGPTAEEREAYALRLRQRRIADTFDDGEAMLAESVRRGMRLGREGQLAAEGAVALAYQALTADVRGAHPGRSRMGGGDLPADAAQARLHG